jgi:hypothetical protein
MSKYLFAIHPDGEVSSSFELPVKRCFGKNKLLCLYLGQTQLLFYKSAITLFLNILLSLIDLEPLDVSSFHSRH